MKEADLKNNLEEISSILAQMKDAEETYSFLRDLLSPSEIAELFRRFKVAKMLEKQISYKNIESETKMSSTTIARIGKFLKWNNKGYKNAILISKSITDKHHTAHHS